MVTFGLSVRKVVTQASPEPQAYHVAHFFTYSIYIKKNKNILNFNLEYFVKE